MRAIMADNDIHGQMSVLVRGLHSEGWRELWLGLNLTVRTFADLSLDPSNRMKALRSMKENPMSTTISILQLNRELAEQMNEDALRNPQSPNAGKFVGIANAKVIVIADNWRAVSNALRQAEPDPSMTFCIQLGRDYTEVHEIWEFA